MPIPPSTNGDDTINIVGSDLPGGAFDGLNGTDTLIVNGGGLFDFSHAASFRNFEILRGTESDDRLVLAADQLAGLTTIDGGGGWDFATIEGASIDLTAATITGFSSIMFGTSGATITVDDHATALMVAGWNTQHDHLVLSGIILTPEERRTLHRRGVDRITDASGVQSIDQAPVFTNFGTGTVIVPKNTTVTLFGPEATISDETGSLNSMTLSVDSDLGVHGRFDLIKTDRVSFSLGDWGSIFVDGVEIGDFDNWSTELRFDFNTEATPERVTQVLRAISYEFSNFGSFSEDEHTIEVGVSDAGYRVTTANFTVQAPNEAPTGISLLRATVIEGASAGYLISSIVGFDPNGSSSLKYTLTDDAGGRFAILEGRLAVADGSKIDYETMKSHKVIIRATDKGGLYLERAFEIAVQDIDEGNSNSANETLVGTKGADKLNGGLGDDRILGKLGKDILTGGVGKDGFVFDTKPSKKNIDKIRDFNAKDDTIQLENKIYKSLSKKTGTLKVNAFWKGKAAHDASDRIIYDKNKGALYYDPDGTGSKAAVQFAILTNKAAISHKDFYII